MKTEELVKMGIPPQYVHLAIKGLRAYADGGDPEKADPHDLYGVVHIPGNYLFHSCYSELANALHNHEEATPISYKIWGKDGIADNAIEQMNLACELPVALAGALMADSHLGYGLPIGGVLALDNAVSPYAVGVDIACRMKLSIFPYDEDKLESIHDDKNLKKILMDNTAFGLQTHKEKQDHAVMDMDWSIIDITKRLKDKAWEQLGSSGGGNHFVEFGTIEYRGQEYLGLLSHSGSRRPGYEICGHYSKIAERALPQYLQKKFKHLAYLSLDSEEGQEYWLAMNLMGEYAQGNHDVIHHNISTALQIDPMEQIDNHHNFAWKETIETEDGEVEAIVHRKGATPAHKGVMGIIPGSMGTPCYVVVGRGNPSSLNSASHGAGRKMSRTEGKATFDFDVEREKLYEQGIKVIGAGSDELPGVYKDINEVMDAQMDLVETAGVFYPRLVRMEGGRKKR